MKKKKIILSAVIVLCAALITGVCVLLNSPVWTLKQMRDDIARSGVRAMRGYLTEDLQHTYDSVESAYSIAAGLGKVTSGISSLFGRENTASDSMVRDIISGLKEEAGTFKISLKKVGWKGSTADVTLDFSVSIYTGSAVLTMVRENRKWLISEMVLPDLGWKLPLK